MHASFQLCWASHSHSATLSHLRAAQYKLLYLHPTSASLWDTVAVAQQLDVEFKGSSACLQESGKVLELPDFWKVSLLLSLKK